MFGIQSQWSGAALLLPALMAAMLAGQHAAAQDSNADGSDLPVIGVTKASYPEYVVESAGKADFFIRSDREPAADLQINLEVSQEGDFVDRYVGDLPDDYPYKIREGDKYVSFWRDDPGRLYEVGRHAVAFDSGTTRQKVTVNIFNDRKYEPKGSVTVKILPGEGYAVAAGDAASSTWEVRDDDNRRNYWIGAQSKVVDEGEDALFYVQSSVAETDDYTLGIRVSEGDGEFLADDLPTQVTVKAGHYHATFAVSTVNDHAAEDDGRITVDLLASPHRNHHRVHSNQIRERRAFVTVRDTGTVTTPTLAVSASNGTVTEGAVARFLVQSQDVAPGSNLSVNVRISQTGDFLGTEPPEAVTLDSGARTANLDIATADDRVREESGSIAVEILPGSGYLVGAGATATMEVSDNDTADIPVILVSASSSIIEGEDAIFVFISDNMVPLEALDIRLSIEQEGDYLAVSPPAAFTLDGTDYGVLRLPTTDDETSEKDGSVTVTVLPDDGYFIMDSEGTRVLAVLDNDPPLPLMYVLSAAESVHEGETARFTIASDTTVPSSDLPIRLRVEQEGEFLAVPVPDSFVLEQGEYYGYLDLELVDDGVPEFDGSVTVTVLDGSGYEVDDPGRSATVAVRDNDPGPQPSIFVGTTSISVEESEVAGFVLISDTAPMGDLTVNLRVGQNGEFLASPAPDSFILRRGRHLAFMNLVLVDDEVAEADGAVFVSVLRGSGYRVQYSDRHASIEVRDNDSPVPEIFILAAGSPVYESEAVRFAVGSGTAAPAADLTVNLRVEQDGEFLAAPIPTSFTLPEGKYLEYMNLPLVHDDAAEPDGSVSATVLAGEGYRVRSSASSASVTVLDSNRVEVSVEVAPGRLVNVDDPLEFVLRADPAPRRDLAVNYKWYEYDDYSNRSHRLGYPLYGTATIRAGQPSIAVSTGGFGNLVSLSRGEPGRFKVMEVEPGPGYAVATAPGNAAAAGGVAGNQELPFVWISNRNSKPPPYYEKSGGKQTVLKYGLNYSFSDFRTLAGDLTVNVSFSDGGLGLLPDSMPTAVTIPAGHSYGHIVEMQIILRDDDAEEASGHVSVTILPGIGYKLSLYDGHTVTWPVSDDDGRVVQISSNQDSVIEGDDVEFTVFTNQVASGSGREPEPFSLTVSLDADDGGSDFIDAFDRTLTLSGTGSAAGTFTVRTLDDSVDEPDGTVTAWLKPGPGYRLGVAPRAAAAVEDNDEGPVVSIFSLSKPLVEGDTAVFQLKAEFPPREDTRIAVTSELEWGRDLGAHADFISSVPETVLLEAGTTETYFFVETEDDLTNEIDGSIVMRIQDGHGYAPHWDAGSASVTVSDNDDTVVSIEAVEDTVFEVGIITFRLTAAGEKSINLPVGIHLDDGDTGYFDSEPSPNKAEFFGQGRFTHWIPHSLGSREFSVRHNDYVTEPDAAVTARILESPYYKVSKAKGSATATVLDDDSVYVTIHVPEDGSGAHGTVREGEPARFELRIDRGEITRDLEVSVRISDDGANAITPFVRKVTIPVGSSAWEFSLPAPDNEANQADWTMFATVVAGDGYRAGQGGYDPKFRKFRVSMTVLDDDVPDAEYMIDVAAVSNSVAEGEKARFRIFLADRELENGGIVRAPAAPAGGLSVSYAVSEDGYSQARTAIIPAGLMETEIEVDAVDDAVSEADDRLTVRIRAASDYAVHSGRAAVPIEDNDALEVSIAPVAAEVTEGEPARFRISSNFSRSERHKVILDRDSLVGGGFLDLDYSYSRYLTLESGSSDLIYSVPTLDDAADEADGEITMRIRESPYYDFAVPEAGKSATVAVLDNDDPVISIFQNTGRWSIDGRVRVRENEIAPFKVVAAHRVAEDLTIGIAATDWGTGHILSYPATVTLEAGEREAAFEVKMNDDDICETKGTISVSVLDGDDYSILDSNGTDYLDVGDDWDGSDCSSHDDPYSFPLDIYANSYSLDELRANVSDPARPVLDVNVPIVQGAVQEGQPITFRMYTNYGIRSTAQEDVTVNLEVTDGGTGYLLSAPQSLTYHAGSLYEEFTVQTRDDSIRGADGFVTVILLGGSGYTFGTLGRSSTVIVRDNDGPEFSIESARSRIDEGADARFRIWTDDDLAEDATVGIEVDDATGGFITAMPKTVEIKAGTRTANLVLGTVDDDADEASGNVAVTILPGSGYAVSSTKGRASVRILDNDSGGAGPVLSIEPFADSVTEGEPAKFRIMSDAAPAESLSVNLRLDDGLSDFIVPVRSIPVSMTGREKIHAVATVDDSVDESSGTVTATILSGPGYSISAVQGQAAVAVMDNDVPEISISPIRNLTIEGQRAHFRLSSDIAPVEDLSIAVKARDGGGGSIAPGQSALTVLLAAGETGRTLEIRTTRDQVDEASDVIVASVEGGPGYAVSETANAARVRVFDNDPGGIGPEVSIFAVDPAVTEGGAAGFRVVMNLAAANDIAVNLNVDDGGGNFISGAPASVELEAGSREHAFSVNTRNGGVGAEGGTVSARILAGDGYSISVLDGISEVAVSDSGVEVGETEVSIADAAAVVEGTHRNAAFTLTASKEFASATMVNVSVAGAVNFIDPAELPRTFLFPADALTAVLNLPIHDDDDDEADGSITVRVDAGAGYEVGASASATVNVADNDTTITIAASSASPVTEGADASFLFISSEDISGALPVRISVTQVGNFISGAGPTSHSLTSAAESRTLNIGTDNDNVNEADGSVTVTVASGSGYEVGAAGTATVDVRDNDTTVTVEAVSASGVVEGAAAVFRLTSSETLTSALTVNITVTESGSFIMGAKPLTHELTPADASRTLEIGTSDDNDDEADGSVTVAIGPGTGYQSGSSASATVDVHDNDTTITIESSSLSSTVVEGDAARFLFGSSETVTSTIVVNITVTQVGSFIAGAAPTSHSISAGAESRTLAIATSDDNLDEANGSITVRVDGGAGYQAGAAASATVNVADNDTTISISAASGTSVTEGADAVFLFAATETITAPLAVSIAVTQSGSFIKGAAPVSHALTSAPASLMLGIETDDDGTDEHDGSITVALQSGAGYAVDSAHASATVNVNDNDGESSNVPQISISSTSPGSITEGADARFLFASNIAAALTVKIIVAETGSFISGTKPTEHDINGSSESLKLSIPTDNDDVDESDGSITVFVISGDGYQPSLVAATSASVNVVDNDNTISIGAQSTSAITEGQTARFLFAAAETISDSLVVGITVSEAGSFISGSRPTTHTLTSAAVSLVLDIATDDDNVDEPDGSITVELLSGTDYEVDMTKSSANVSVTDNDGHAATAVPEISVAFVNSSVIEGAPAKFTISSPTAPDEDLTVRYTVAQTGIVLAGPAAQRTVVLEKGARSKAFDVATDDDEVDEVNGTVTVVLAADDSNPVKYAVTTKEAGRSAGVEIADDDVPVVSILNAADPIVEGKEAVFPISIAPVPYRDIILNLTVDDGQRNFLDSQGALTATVLIESGRSESSLKVQTVVDEAAEGDGILTVSLLSGEGYVPAQGTGSTAVATVRSKVVPTVSIKSLTDAVDESNPARFVVSASPAPVENLQVAIELEQVGNYMESSPSTVMVEIEADHGEARFAVSTEDDRMDEEDGWILARVLPDNGGNYVRGAQFSDAVKIADDDDMPEIMIEPIQRSQVTEGAPVRFRLYANGTTSERDLMIRIAVAQTGDFVALGAPGHVMLESGAASAELEIPTVDDNAVEENGTVTVRILTGQHYRPHALQNGTVAVESNDVEGLASTQYSVAASVIESILLGIGSNDSVPVGENQVAAASVTAVTPVVEEGAPARFNVSVLPEAESMTVINLAVSGSAGILSESPPTEVTLMPGTREAMIELPTTNDGIPESDGVIVVKIDPGEGYHVNLDGNNALVTVSDSADRQRRDSAASVSRTVLPDMLEMMGRLPIDVMATRMENAFDVPRGSTVTIGGGNGLKEMILQGGEAANDESLFRKSILGDSSLAFALFPDMSENGGLTAWMAGNHHSWGAGGALAGQFGLDAVLGYDFLTGLSVSTTEAESEASDSFGRHELRYQAQATGIHPYLGWIAADGKTQLNASGGFGLGEVGLDQGEFGQASAASRFFTLDFRGEKELYAAAEPTLNARNEVSVAGEAGMARQFVDDPLGYFGDAEYGGHRIRLVATATRELELRGGGTLVPALSISISDTHEYDLGGEFGGDISYDSPMGLSMSASGNALMSAGGQIRKEFGGSMAYDAGKDGLGLRMDIDAGWHRGHSGSFDIYRGMEHSAYGIPTNSNGDGVSMETEIGYGLGMPGGESTLTPYLKAELLQSRGTRFGAGSRLISGPGVNFDFEGTHEPRRNGGSERKLRFNGLIRW